MYNDSYRKAAINLASMINIDTLQSMKHASLKQPFFDLGKSYYINQKRLL